ncbi:MAG: TolB family protein [Bacteroidales bacterium]
MLLRQAFTSLVWVILFTAARAQYYDTGVDPASAKWLQVKTGRFRVVYPTSYGDEGIKFARSLEDSYRRLSEFYQGINVRIPVIIHNYTTISNGYVAWAPKRMEIFPTPEQNTIPMSNTEQLTLHEMTHVMQMKSLYKGISRLFSIPFGEQYYGILAAYLPEWFLEGDAVLMETALSESGRGRTPSFHKQLKALSLERGKMYRYDKILHGSYRDFIPNEYRYGYQMVAWANEKYGHQLWNKTIESVGKYPFSVFPVNLSLKKDALLTKEKLFRETFNSLNIKWKNEEQNNIKPAYNTINPTKKNEYINYYSPVKVGEDSIAAIKTTLYNPAEIVLINTVTGKEKRIHIPGEVNPYFLSGISGKITWVENHPDLRWENRHFSVVKIMDIRTGRVQQLSHMTRYLAAGISPDGRFVATVENNLSNENFIVILDAFNGEVVNKIQVPENIYPQRPQWSASGNEITFISLSDEGEGIIVLTLNNWQFKTLKKHGRDDLQASFLRNDSLFFISSASSVDNVWLLTPEGREIRITDSRFGMYDLHISGNYLYCTDYSAGGNNICLIRLDEIKCEYPISAGGETLFKNCSENINKKIPSTDTLEFVPKPYRKWLHPFRFHSWMPFYADIDEIQSDPSAIKPGITLLSQNLLNTVISTIGYEYSDKEHIIHTRFTLKGQIPVFESKINYGGSPDIIKPSGTTGDPSVIKPSLQVINSVSVPLSFSSGNFTHFLWTHLSASYYNRYIFIKEKNVYDYGQTEITGRVFFSNYSRSGLRNIFPRWAQIVDYSYTFFPADKDIYGTQATLRTAVYFPGPVRNHGVRLRFEADYQKPERFLLYNRAEWPRGYDEIISTDLKFISADYVMPLFYPDLIIPGLLYVKRLRTGFFYDFARATDNTYIKPSGTENVKGTETFRSFGTEVIADFFVLRIPFMISGGIQASWKNLKKEPSIKAILRMDIYGMIIGGKKFKGIFLSNRE